MSKPSKTRIPNHGQWRDLQKQGFTVYRRWQDIPDNLYTASRGKRDKVALKSEPAAYHLSGDSEWITLLFEVSND